MQLDWTTFALEVINFLVLVWILQRFLYRPVTAVIARREAEIGTRLTEAQAMRAEAQALKVEFEGRAAAVDREREAARAGLHEEVALERTRLLAGLAASLEAEREKARGAEQQRLGELRRLAQDEALRAAGVFASRLLARLACADLEARIGEVLIEDLARMSTGDGTAFGATAGNVNEAARVVSVYPLEQSARDALERALSGLAGKPVVGAFELDANLVAGLRITLGSWVVRANLQDELRWFVKEAHYDG